MTVILWLAAMVAAATAQFDEPVQTPKKVACSDDFNLFRTQFINHSECDLRQIYLGLTPPTAYQSVAPETLWVRRCVGSCTYSGLYFPYVTCVANKKSRRILPVSLYNVKTDQSHCSRFVVEQDENCICKENRDWNVIN